MYTFATSSENIVFVHTHSGDLFQGITGYDMSAEFMCSSTISLTAVFSWCVAYPCSVFDVLVIVCIFLFAVNLSFFSLCGSLCFIPSCFIGNWMLKEYNPLHILKSSLDNFV